MSAATFNPPASAAPIIVTTNRAAILETLCHATELSRLELSERTGISVPTVHRLCAQLEKEDLIAARGEKRDGNKGRPVSLFRFRSESHAVLAVAIRSDRMIGALVGLDGTVLKHLQYSCLHDDEEKGYNYVATTIDLLRTLQRHAQDAGIPCHGIGVAVPGIVQPNGLVSHAPELGWVDVPLPSILEKSFSEEILVENNANAFTYGEWSRGVAQGRNPVVGFFPERVGVGSGIVCDGGILHGYRGGAGEVGSMLTGTTALNAYHINAGDLETQFAQLVAKAPDSNPGVQRQLLDLTILSIANISALIDPETIVISPSISMAGARRLIDAARERLTGRIPHVPQIVLSQLGDMAPIVGMGELIAERVRGGIFNG